MPPLDDYAAVIGQALAQGLAGRPGQPPTLVFESGRAVVDDAQVLAASVVGTKRLPDGRRAALLDAGINLMLTALWYNHPVWLVPPKPGLPEETALFGPLCMNIDVMRHTVSLPPPTRGDRLVFAPVGAYNNTQWLQFIEYRPPVLLVHADDGHSVLREAEDLDSMCQHERLPAHLQQPAKAPAIAPAIALAGEESIMIQFPKALLSAYGSFLFFRHPWANLLLVGATPQSPWTGLCGLAATAAALGARHTLGMTEDVPNTLACRGGRAVTEDSPPLAVGIRRGNTKYWWARARSGRARAWHASSRVRA